MRIARLFLVAYLLAMPAYCLFRVFQIQQGVQLLTVVMPLLMSGFAIAHMIGQYAWRRGLAMTLSAIIISLGAEVLGVSTGWLFGDYIYTDQLGLKAFGLVPWLIPAAWLMVLYPAWKVTKSQATGGKWQIANSKFHGSWLMAALAVTAYDLSLDPRMVADGNWVWHGGGVYFGIPVSNFVGWFATACVIFWVWGWLLRGQPDTAKTQDLRKLNAIPLPVLAYIVLWVGETVANIFFWSGPLVGLIVFVAMGIFAAPALWRYRPKHDR